jgi:hypothetical protein
MNLVTQSFGRESEYRRAVFAIWSAWAHYKHDLPLILFTDCPNFFEPYFSGQNVTYVFLTPEKIKHMRGEIDFLHRMKIALIEEAFSMAKSHLIYIDSDTFFVNDPSNYLFRLEKGMCHMHVPEYSFSAIREMKLPAAREAHAFLDLIENNKFVISTGEEISIDVSHYSWNAGAMFLPYFVKDYLDDVFALTDQFYPKTKHHASEQFAFSIILQMKTKVYGSNDAIYHYWYRVKKVVIDAWLEKVITSLWATTSIDVKIDFVKKWTLKLPGHIQNHVLVLRDGAIQAFHENKFWSGYKFAFRALLKDPLEVKFLREVFYHTKRLLK